MSQSDVLDVLKENRAVYLTVRKIVEILNAKGIVVNYNSICSNLTKLKKTDSVLYRGSGSWKYALEYRHKES